MPELPEVESLTRMVRSVLEGGRLEEAVFLRQDLRAPIPIDAFRDMLVGQVIESVSRRSKYMLLKSSKGCGVFHLGMSGKILESNRAEPEAKHTHAIFTIKDVSGAVRYLHFVDPRRFGRIDCLPVEALAEHALFHDLGPEPIDTQELGQHLFKISRGRKTAIKCFIMDARNVVGVGNIYASESLFRAGISPRRRAGVVTRVQYESLATAIKATLLDAIAAGGTTFRDFKTPDGKPGYFAVSLNVYNRDGQPCRKCGRAVRLIRQSGRATYYCAFCQK